MIDVLLVKYGHGEKVESMWSYTLRYMSSWEAVNVLVQDNNCHNVGLTRARMELLEKSDADYIVLMDFDFSYLSLDIHKMVELAKNADIGIVVPRPLCDPLCEQRSAVRYNDSAVEYTHKPPCHLFLLERAKYDSIGGLDPRFHTAKADVDFVQRVWNAGLKIVQHVGSTMLHVGLTKAGKRTNPALYLRDVSRYREKWGGRSIADRSSHARP